MMWSASRKVGSVGRFSKSVCALSAAEGLVLLSKPARGLRRVPTANVHVPSRRPGAGPDRVVTVPMFTAGNDELLSPPLTQWPSVATSDFACVRHAAVLPKGCASGTLRVTLLVWFSEECMDDRPVSMLSRRLGLTTAAGVPVQGPVVVCGFGPAGERGWSDYGAGSPVIHGAGEWVHVPTLGACVERVPVLPSQAYANCHSGVGLEAETKKREV
jgi:hypothetical protein